MADQKSMRIWYQSFIDETEERPYFERMKARLDKVARPGTVFVLHGMRPPDRHFHAVTEFRGGDQTIRNAVRAAEEGYDAFVIGHFPDPGLFEARGAVDIPVIGLGEATMLFAMTMGRKIGLVTINPVFIPIHEAQIASQQFASRVVGVTAIEADVSRFMRGFTDADERKRIRDEFADHVAPLIGRGADVLIPSGGMPMLLFSEEQPFLVRGALVLEGIATIVKAAEMAVDLHRLTGAAAARSGLYQLASKEAIQDYRAKRE
jgi:Asp/Glu/hydantoin racemase